MKALRRKILEQKLDGMDEKHKRIYRIAERICRKEYEKAFDLDLDLPFGHPKNKIGIRDGSELWKLVAFWIDLKQKYEDRDQTPLSIAMVFFCDLHAGGIIKIMQNIQHVLNMSEE